MAHDSTTGRIYIDANSGVSISDVNTILAAGSLDLGTLCRSTALIKKWAKYKPMPIGTPAGYTDAQAKAINYGLYVPYYNTTFHTFLSDVRAGVWSRASNYDASKTPWVNQGVTAGNWFRLLDFNEYQGNAPAPVSQISATPTTVQLRDNPRFQLPFGSYNSAYLTLSDFGCTIGGTDYRGSNLYLWIAVHDPAGGGYISSSNTFWESSGLSATAINQLVSRQYATTTNFAFDRNLSPVTRNIVACAFLSDQSSGLEMDSEGVFIPVIPSRAAITMTFELPSLGDITYSTVNPWFVDSADNMTTLIKFFPNGNFSGTFSIVIRNTANDTVWAQIDAVTLNVYCVKGLDENDEEQQYPAFLRFSTGGSGASRTMTVSSITGETFVSEIEDIYYDFESYTVNGTRTTAITSGTIYDGVPVQGVSFSMEITYALMGSSQSQTYVYPL